MPTDRPTDAEVLAPFADDTHPLKNTHLLSWLRQGYVHCKNGSEDWAQGYLDSAKEYIEAFEAVARDLHARLSAPSSAADAERYQTAPSVSSAGAGDTQVAWRDILAERQRQIKVEGWTPEHDDQHDDGQMAIAAACYALPEWQRDRLEVRDFNRQTPLARRLWPWDTAWWKPKDPRSDLVRAGALILAEIERLDRLSTPEKQTDA